MHLDDLMEAVVYDNYCDWNLFLENVLCQDVTKHDLAEAVSECQSKEELNKIINTFI